MLTVDSSTVSYSAPPRTAKLPKMVIELKAERNPPTRLLTVTDVASALQVSERAVRRWIAEGRLPAVHFGRAVRIRPADLAQVIAAGLAD